MNAFCCVVRADGSRLPDEWRARFARVACLRGLEYEQVEGAGFWALLGGNAAGRQPEWARCGGRIAVGTARLDERPRVVGRCEGGKPATDLERILCAAASDDELPALLTGDFAYVVYDEGRRVVRGARDPFGVDPLYYRVFGGMIAFSSRAELLASGAEYDRAYFAEFLARAGDVNRTPYPGVSAVPAAHAFEWSDGKLTLRRYWSAESYVEPNGASSALLIEEFRERLQAAVRTRLSPDGRTWAQLSGGLDSSTVVCVAQHLANSGVVPHGLGGTVTLVDSHGTGGDQRAYSDLVIQATGLPNAQIGDFAWAEGDGRPAPWTDQPSPAYLMYARDRCMAQIARDAGADALLTGYGPDHYLGGSAVFLADWVARGRLRAAFAECTRWSVAGRVSFWKFAFHNIGLLLLPGFALQWFLPAAALPTWLDQRAVRDYGLAGRGEVRAAYGGRMGHKYVTSIMRALERMPGVLALHAVTQDIIEERHPFLDRRLAEFALGLPGAMCSQPMARKWILREAMRDMLPESVRTRPGKGSIDGSLAWALSHPGPRLRALFDRPLLADIGLIDPSALRWAVEHAGQQTADWRAAIVRTLGAELWLQVRSGQLG